MVNNDYIVKKVFRKYLMYSVLSSIAGPIGMVVDGVIVSNFLGKDALAVTGIISPIYILLTALSGVIASGSTSLCGQYIGKEQPEKVKGVFSSAMLWSLVLNFLFMAACFFIPEQISRMLGASDQLLTMCTQFIRCLGIGLGLSILHLALVEFTKLDGSPSLGPISVAVVVIVNFVLNLVFVLGFKMGIVGIGIATSISYYTAILVCCTHFIKPICTLKLVKIKAPIHDFIQLCKYGLPRAGNGVCFAITTAIMNYRLLFLGGSVAVAAFAIQSSIAMVVGAVSLGIGSTVLLLSGIFYGEEDKNTLENAVKVSLREGVILTVAISVLGFIFATPILGSLFGQGDPAVTAMAVTAVRWKLVGLAFYTINLVLINFYQSAENLKMANFVSITEALPTQALYVMLLPLFMGIDGNMGSLGSRRINNPYIAYTCSYCS